MRDCGPTVAAFGHGIDLLAMLGRDLNRPIGCRRRTADATRRPVNSLPGSLGRGADQFVFFSVAFAAANRCWTSQFREYVFEPLGLVPRPWSIAARIDLAIELAR